MTLSIVARDPVTGQMGVVVQTAYFAVGAFVPWLRPGVGAVASQAITEPAHGPAILDRLAGGMSTGEALAEVIGADPQRQIRQLGVVDAAGDTASHTGQKCMSNAGHVAGDGVSVQCNLAAADGVWDTMLTAFEESDGSLTGRMMEALFAGERAGGDVRGRQSAALVVVSGDSRDAVWRRTIDLRVDDHPAPLDELARLLEVHRAYSAMGDGIESLFQGRPQESLPGLATATALRPTDAQALFWQAAGLESAGQPEEAAELLERAVEIEPGWRQVWADLQEASPSGSEDE